MASEWRNFKNISSRPLFTIIFRPKIVILDTDSILRVKTMYELVRHVKSEKIANFGFKEYFFGSKEARSATINCGRMPE